MDCLARIVKVNTRRYHERKDDINTFLDVNDVTEKIDIKAVAIFRKS